MLRRNFFKGVGGLLMSFGLIKKPNPKNNWVRVSITNKDGRIGLHINGQEQFSVKNEDQWFGTTVLINPNDPTDDRYQLPNCYIEEFKYGN